MSRSLVLCALCSSVVSACVLVVDADGRLVTEVREVEPFTEAVNQTFAELRLSPGAGGDAELRCDERVLGRLITEVEDGVLVVRQEPGWRLGAWGLCTVTVTMQALTPVASSGSGAVEVGGLFDGFAAADVSGSGALWLESVTGEAIALRSSGSGAMEVGWLEAERLRVDASGSGGVVAAGVADMLVLDVSGSGSVDLSEVAAMDAEVRVSGSGSARVQASGSVTGSLTGSGGLEVRGGGDVDVRVTGSGRVVER